MQLTKKQTIALDILENDFTNQLLFGGGAGGGKSALGCYWILKMCFKYPETRWLIGRSKLKNLKETTLQTFFEIVKMQGLDINEFKYNQAESSIWFSRTGSKIILKDLSHMPSDPEYQRLGSLEITGGFIDEVGEIPQKATSIVASRMRYKLDEYKLIPKLLMTCNPVKNWIYTDFYKKHKDGTIEPYKMFIQSLVMDNPHISKHYIEQLNRLDKISRMRLLQGDWEYENTEDKLYDYDKLVDCFSNSFVEGGETFISCDVARFGVDKTIICVWNGWRLEDIVRIDKSDLVEVGRQIQELAQFHKVMRSHIVIDEDGIGGGVVDMIRGCKGFKNGSKPFDNENFANLKTQCYYKLADKVNKGEVYIGKRDWQEDIIAEFEVVRRHHMDKDTTKLAITPKETIKSTLGRSPDYADAIMMRMFFELNKTRITYFS
ncbi:MAG: putative terminase large subunit [Prokaryotic dsDNA virus sp.]|mgnify:FL=1|nr:MAG: putative terminase large subunit [Prokaryotic dsDNA virus sp.]